MNVTINIDRDTGPTELSAVIAFCLALGGTAGQSVAPVAPAPARPSNPVGDALLEQHAASVAARAAPPPPPVPTDEDEGESNGLDTTKLDVEGVPYDARIHSERPTMNKDGTWRKKRGVDEVYFGQIHGELQAAHAAPPAPPPPAPTASAEPAPNAPTPTAAPPAPTAEAPAAPAPAASASDGGRFAGFPEFVQAVSAIRSPSIPYVELNNIAASVAGAGVDFKDLKNRPDVWDMFYMMAGGR